MRSLDEFAGEKLDELERAQLRRVPSVTARSGIWAERDGRRLFRLGRLGHPRLDLPLHHKRVFPSLADMGPP